MPGAGDGQRKPDRSRGRDTREHRGGRTGSKLKEGAVKGAQALGIPPAATRFVLLALGVVATLLISLAGIATVGNLDKDAQYGTANKVRLGSDPHLSADALNAYQLAALKYTDQSHGGALPWTVIAAIAELATEHGKVSPYPEDRCDRNPAQPAVRQPAATAATPSTTAGDAHAANVAACGGKNPSNFPEVVPGIGNKDQDQGLGPFLILPAALTGTHVDPNRLDVTGDSSTDPTSATMFIAEQLDHIRSTMIDTEHWSIPDAANTPSGDTPEAYASRFWSAAVARLPIVDPRNTTCGTPQPENNPDSVAAAIATTWHCELLHTKELHTYTGLTTELDRTAAAELILDEAFNIAYAFSGYGATNSTQDLCGRVPVASSGTADLSSVTIVGDSLTVGARDSGGLEAKLEAKGIAANAIRIDAESSRFIINAANKDVVDGLTTIKHLAPTSGVVVAALGTNGAGNSSFGADIDTFMAAIPSTVTVIWFTIDIDSDAARTANVVLAAKAAAHPNMVVKDWQAFAASHQAEWKSSGHASDIHYNAAGYQARAQFIADNLTGTATTGGAAPLIGGTAPAADAADKPVAVADDVPVGVFPLTNTVFNAFNPVAGASRCDLGANIHAAVRAFIAGESVPGGVQAGGDGQIGDRDIGELGTEPYNPMIGGWRAMPWALGSGPELATFVAKGPWKPLDPTPACTAAINAWITGASTHNEFAGLTDETIVNADLAALTALVTPDSPVGAPVCDNRVDGTVESLASGMIDTEGFAAPAPTSTVAPGDPTATTVADAEASPTGTLDIPPAPTTTSTTSTTTAVSTTPPGSATTIALSPEEASAAQTSANLDGFATYLRHQILAAPESATLPPQPGIDVLIPRFSPSGRATATAPHPTLQSVGFSDGIVTVAVAFGGILADDSRFNPDADPFLTVIAVLNAGTVTTPAGTVAALPGVPAPLLAAVNNAIALAPALVPACTIDAAFLLANAKHETGPWWSQMQSDGTLIIKSSAAAYGPFQFLESTWTSYASDGNGDGVTDINNAFDEAIGAMKLQCADAAGYDNNLINDATAFGVAADYNGGPGSRAATARCVAEGVTDAAGKVKSGCTPAWYAGLRVQTAKDYRAQIAAALAVGGAGTVTTAGSATPSNLAGAPRAKALKDRTITPEYVRLTSQPNLQLDKEAAASFAAVEAMYGQTIRLSGASRSAAQQAIGYAQHPDRFAPPGHSLHEVGLAVDVDMHMNLEDPKLINAFLTNGWYRVGKKGDWYGNGQQVCEPWHWSYGIGG